MPDDEIKRDESGQFASTGTVKVGQKVRVKFRTGGGHGIQEGTVKEVHADGSFKWDNGANVVRTAQPEHVTDEAKKFELHPYVKKWVADEEKASRSSISKHAHARKKKS